jgi:DNA-binding IclR family transcriptional regulator
MSLAKPLQSETGTSLRRGVAVLRALAAMPSEGSRLKDIAAAVAMPTASVHRLLSSLLLEGMVEQDRSTKRYRLGLELFELASKAGDPGRLREIARPFLLRLSSTFNESLFLLVRSGFDTVCLDRSEGPFPIRTFTGEIGGRAALGLGQAGIVILAFLSENEREEVLRYNMPRLRERGVDELYLRSEIQRASELGYAGRSIGMLPGMAAVAVPLLGRDNIAFGALSITSITERLPDERLAMVSKLLRREANLISAQVSPFDPALRHQ